MNNEAVKSINLLITEVHERKLTLDDRRVIIDALLDIRNIITKKSK